MPPVSAAATPHTPRAARGLRLWTAALLGVALAACSHRPAGPAASAARGDDAAVRAFASRGYPAVDQTPAAPATPSNSTWTVDGRPVHVLLLRPQRQGPHPLVVYLPGLGERSDAGARWRGAWAAAGYAVMSLQPLEEDVGVWRSDLARTGEFKALGRQHFGSAALTHRVQVLAEVLRQARQRSAEGDPGWRDLDWSRVALAGFDVGAYTAQFMAGEQVPGAPSMPPPLSLRAALVLSPYASTAAGHLDTRYAGIRLPVLSITSDADADVLGLIEGPSLRVAPFQHMPGPDQYLLSLQGLSHAALGGSSTAGPTDAAAATEPARRGADAGSRSGDDAGGQRQRGGKRSGGGEGGRGDRTDGRRSGGAGDAAAATLTPAAWQMRLQGVQDVSTAFLDAYVKGDSLAREWLASDAQRWLGPMGELRRK